MDQPQPETEDPARRFYERSHAELSKRHGSGITVAAPELAAGNHRYSAAYRYLNANPGRRVLEMGYGGTGIIENLAPLAGHYEIVDIIDRFAGQTRPANLTLHIDRKSVV